MNARHHSDSDALNAICLALGAGADVNLIKNIVGAVRPHPDDEFHAEEIAESLGLTIEELRNAPHLTFVQRSEDPAKDDPISFRYSPIGWEDYITRRTEPTDGKVLSAQSISEALMGYVIDDAGMSVSGRGCIRLCGGETIVLDGWEGGEGDGDVHVRTNFLSHSESPVTRVVSGSAGSGSSEQDETFYVYAGLELVLSIHVQSRLGEENSTVGPARIQVRPDRATGYAE